MKHFFLYIIFIFLASSCKIDKKQTSNSLAESIKLDSIDAVTKKEQKAKTLKEKLVGKIYKGGEKIPELSEFSSQGSFHIGSIENSPRYTSITFKKNNRIKVILFLRVDDESSNEALILDILEIDKETDVFKKFPNKDIDVFSDVLRNGERAPELLALAEYEESDVMTNVYKVWRANRKTGKFEEVKDISGITVVNEDY